MIPAPGRVHDLDVRPVLGKGGDPFGLILGTVKALTDGDVLHLIAPFEPVPLYAVLGGLGYAADHEVRDGAHHVWFRPKGGAPPSAPEPERAPLQPPVELDVRGLEPPAPMMTILEKLVELGPGAQLLVHHHREPVLLYEKLKLRGYAAKATPVCAGEWRIHVAPAWALEDARS